MGIVDDEKANPGKLMFVSSGPDPTIEPQFVARRFETVADKAGQFAAFEQHENARWKKIIETGHITADCA